MSDISKTQVHARDGLMKKLSNLLDSTFLPSSLYIFGNTSAGKTYSVKHFLQSNPKLESIYLNCIEFSTSRQLFESIIYDLTKEESKIDGIDDFLYEFQGFLVSKLVLVLDNAERLRDMEANVLQLFIELQQLSALNVCVVFISQLPFEKLHSKETSEQPIQIYVPNYTKEEVCTILLSQFNASLHSIENSQDLFSDYLNIFLNVFFKACRDLQELQFMANKFFPQYYEPIVSGEVERHEAQKLWRNISKVLKTGMSQVYLRFLNVDNNLKLIPKNYDLPFYAKYLLIAGFLASHNEAKDDKRLFMKNHGKQRKRARDVNKIKVADKSKLILGPKSFTIDRLLAIFYAIMEEKVSMTCNLMAQISTLCKLRLFKVASGENNILDGGMKVQCAVGLEFIVQLSRSLDFDIKPYLATFA